MRQRSRTLRLVEPAGRHYPRKNKLKRFLSLVLLALVAVLLLKCGHALFQVREIRVTGSGRLEQREFIEQAGIAKGMSMWLVRSAKAVERLELLPFVAGASVEKIFPSTVLIALAERVPAAYLIDRERLWVLDGEGTAFELCREFNRSLPVITGVDSDEVVLGGRLACPDSAKAVSAFLQALGTRPELEVSELNAADSSNLVLYTLEGQKVFLGGYEKMAEKLTLIWEAAPYLAELAQSNYLDVRTGDRLIVLSGYHERLPGEVIP